MNSEVSEAEITGASGQASAASKLGWLLLVAIVFGSLLIANYLRPELVNKKELAALGYTLLEDKVALDAHNVLPALTDLQGNLLTPDTFRGHWNLVFFGFTFCPDVCPTTLAVLSKLVNLMGDQAPQVIFISVDPQRDTPAQIAQYVSAFNPAFLAFRGSEEDTREMAMLLQTVYSRDETAGDANYLVDHSTHVAVINPEAVFSGLFHVPHQEERMAKVLRILR